MDPPFLSGSIACSEVLFSFVSHELLWSDWSKAERVTIRAEGKRRY